MGQPTWREIRKLKVPGDAKMAWTPAMDFVTPGKLYRIIVDAKQEWKPDSGSAKCNADGDATVKLSSEVVLSTSAIGALIAKIGGSTADLKPDTNKVTVFSAGRHCVFSVADATKAGPLYLGINDLPNSQAKVAGQIEVTIEESL
ncbi:MAG: hypothetical protein ABR594_16625 [Pyrinomonadaceae bacterium]